jgi:hypothetical protein
MRFSGLKNIFKIHLRLRLEAWWCDDIMTQSSQLEVKFKTKNIFEIEKRICAKLQWNVDRLVVCIRHDSAEI